MKKALISGAGIAGLATAWWLKHIGYEVTIVEKAPKLRGIGAAIDIKEDAIDIVKRMGLYDELAAQRLQVEQIEFKNTADETVGSITVSPSDELEIERAAFLNLLQSKVGIDIQFDTTVGQTDGYDIIVGCDGIHSGVRKSWFGPESDYSHSLGARFNIITVDKLLVPVNTMQLYNEPGKGLMLNAYNNKTDIIYCYTSDDEITGWRSAELKPYLDQQSYAGEFAQIKMPTWYKGNVVLVGDAAYAASPAAGMGASLALMGAAALADALSSHDDYSAAFLAYEQKLRPYMEQIQAIAAHGLHTMFIPATQAEIDERNKQTEF